LENPRSLRAGQTTEPLRVLWITPLRALAADTVDALRRPVDDLGLPWEVALRHGDTSAHQRKKQRDRYPTVLVTTPESLSLLLTYSDTRAKFRQLDAVILDEWHELLGTKRGVQTELCLARLRTWQSNLRIWGLSATLGNLDEAKRVLLGAGHESGVLVGSEESKEIEIETLIPESMECFPWAGHLGARMAPQVAARVDEGKTTLVFTNTRSQAEIWFQKLQELRSGWGDRLALHHGSIDKGLRATLEARLDKGEMKAVVCTSSLDLGVDFSPVDQVIQIGSPKGIARLMQRAGRSGHQPGALSRVIGVPTSALELVEFAAARDAMQQREIEARIPIRRSLDVLVQHLITLALGGGLTFEAVRNEISTTHAFADLTEEEWAWAAEFACHGGPTLRSYPLYQRIAVDPDTEMLSVPSRSVAQFHRMSIGTITSSPEVQVKMQNGKSLGTVEESFVSRMRPGTTFHFAGRRLQLVRLRDMVATVCVAKKKAGVTPAWQGGRSPLSSELALAVSRRLAGQDLAPSLEMDAMAPLLALQQTHSTMPSIEKLLIETIEIDGQSNVFAYPFAGRLVNEGLAALFAYRLGKKDPLTIRTTINDYGLSMQLQQAVELDADRVRGLLSTESLLEDLLECMNTGELARRQFREISRVAGLVIQGYPGRRKSMRQVQTSSNLLFDVFEKYDPDNLLLAQARHEILDRQLELTRLKATLARLQESPMIFVELERLTPMAFPLWAEQLHSEMSTEDWRDRLELMMQVIESRHDSGRVDSSS
jgi:ATP-dependent Lhr-like helicase